MKSQQHMGLEMSECWSESEEKELLAICVEDKIICQMNGAEGDPFFFFF